MILQQIYSGNGISNFIKLPEICGRCYKKTFWSLFSGHTVQWGMEGSKYMFCFKSPGYVSGKIEWNL